MIRHRLTGKILPILLAAAMLLTVALPPVTVWAADGNLAVMGTEGGYTYDSGVLTFTQDGSYTVSMASGVTTTTADTIVVASGVTADITLNGVKIDRSLAGGRAFELEETAKVTLTLTRGTANSLTGGEGSYGIGSAGLRVPEGAELTIGGTGTLTATGGNSGAGIGGDWKDFSPDCGTITITDGIITAKGGLQSAGIGGGNDGNGGTITIRGGTVTATGGDWGAGIGGGDGMSGSSGNGNGGTISISGGMVTANGGNRGAGIGGGYGGIGDGGSGGTINISSGTVIAEGGDGGAGIGGGYGGYGGGDGGSFTASGGTVTATGGNNGAGIGGGSNGDAGTVTLSGGTVTANGGYSGAGIGGGVNGDGGDVYISGGSIKAVANGGSTSGGDFGEEAQAIGYGWNFLGGSTSGTLKYSDAIGSPDVYLTTVTLRNIKKATAVSSLTTSAVDGYGTNGMMTDSDGKLFLYLPSGTKTTAAQTSARAYTGEVITTGDHQASGTLSSGSTSSGGGGGGGGGSTPAGYLPDSAISTTDNGVTVELGSNATRISADQVSSLISANRESSVVIRGAGYTLTFPQGTMQVIPGQREYDFGLQINTGSPDGILGVLAGDGLAFTLSFNHSGPLPAEAIITFNAGTVYVGRTLHYYYYNPTTGNLEYLQSATVGPDGMVSVRQSRCSDYLFADRVLTGDRITGRPDRISGQDRYQTAVEISRAYFTKGTDTVVLTRGDSPVDALPAVPLAKKYNAPLLLTPTGSLPQAVLSEIKTLGAKKAIIIGGTGAVSADTENTLKAAGLEVERVSGSNRYETAYEVALRLSGGNGQAVLVNGNQAERAFPDVLSISSWAGYHGVPILYADSTAGTLPASTTRAIHELQISRTVLAGGTGVLPVRLEALVPEPTRYGGSDRYATNSAVLKALQPEPGMVFLATGADFADALAGAAAAAQSNGWLVLAGGSPSGLTAGQEQLLQGTQGKVREFRVLGGPSAVPEHTLEAVRALLGL